MIKNLINLFVSSLPSYKVICSCATWRGNPNRSKLIIGRYYVSITAKLVGRYLVSSGRHGYAQTNTLFNSAERHKHSGH